MSKSKPNAYALLIGVNDYSAYDASAGLAPTTSDLKGAEHDVRHYWHMARALGIPAGNIRVACAPSGGEVLRASALPGDSDAARVTGASLAEIEEGLTWLAGKLDTSGVSAGMISISSHGSYDAQRGSLICASDTQLDGETLTGTLPMAALFKGLAGRPDETPVTIFMDACDAGDGTAGDGDRGRALRGGPAGVRKDAELKRRSDDLLLAASAPGTESFEIAVDNTFRGAFSWAVLAVLERWGIHRTATDTHFDITYGHLRQRVDALLEAMNVQQTAHFDAKEDQAARKVFAELLSIELGAPDRPFFTGGREISPGSNGYVMQYAINKGVDLKATLYVPGKDCNGWDDTKMYWFKSDVDWDSFASALENGTFTIEVGSSVAVSDPDLPKPEDHDALYSAGDTWTEEKLGTVNGSAAIGSFQFSGIDGYIVADPDGSLRWLLEADPETPYIINDTESLTISPTTAPTWDEEYYEADD